MIDGGLRLCCSVIAANSKEGNMDAVVLERNPENITE